MDHITKHPLLSCSPPGAYICGGLIIRLWCLMFTLSVLSVSLLNDFKQHYSDKPLNTVYLSECTAYKTHTCMGGIQHFCSGRWLGEGRQCVCLFYWELMISRKYLVRIFQNFYNLSQNYYHCVIQSSLWLSSRLLMKSVQLDTDINKTRWRKCISTDVMRYKKST